MRALVFLRWPVMALAVVCSLAWGRHAAALAGATIVWQQDPATATVVNPAALTISLADAPAVATGLTGDFNNDCSVNASDLSLFAHHYLTGIGSLLYSPLYDLNHDGVINVLDLQIFAAHFLQHC